MKIKIYNCLLFLCLPFWVFAQTNKDYILTIEQDTLYGRIVVNQGKDPISFKYDGHKLTYHPSTIQYFGIYRDAQHRKFRSLSSPSGRRFFVEVLLEGTVNLYKLTEKHLYANSTLDRYVYLLGSSDEALTTVTSSSYQRILKLFLVDYPHLQTKLTNTSFAEIPQIIQEYNQVVRL